MLMFIQVLNNTNMPNQNQLINNSETPNETFDPTRFGIEIGSSPEFYEARAAFAEAYRHDEAAQDFERPYTVAAAAAELAKQNETKSGHMNLKGHTFNVISKIPAFVEANLALDEMEQSGYHVTRKDRLPYIRELSDFNSSLKDLIDTNPKLGFKQTSHFFTSMANGMYSGQYNELVKRELEYGLMGMRHEIAAEQIMGYLDVDYREATTNEDLKGVDFYVSLDGRREFGIDIKASEDKETQKRQQAAQHGNPISRIMWTGAYASSFGDSFRIPNNLAQSLAPDFYQKLLHAESEAMHSKYAA